MSKYCPQCGNRMEDDELFCGKCGTRVEIAETAASPVQRPAEGQNSAAATGTVKSSASKKIALLVPIIVVIIIAVLLISSSKPSGTYYPAGAGSHSMSSITFDKGHITIKTYGVPVDGTYKIQNGKITIKYGILGYEDTLTGTYKKKGNHIWINDEEFVKQG